MLGGHEPRKDDEATLTDDVVVEATAELDAAIFDDAESPAVGAILGIELLEHQDAMGDALHLQVMIGAGHVVEQEHGAGQAGEELLQREDLASIAERAAGQKSQLGE